MVYKRNNSTLFCHQWIPTAHKDFGEAYKDLRVPQDDDRRECCA